MIIVEVVFSRYETIVGLAGAEGTPVRLDLPVPADVIGRMAWYSGKEERQAKVTPDGTLASVESVNRTLRLTPRTARDFDSLLRTGPVSPDRLTDIGPFAGTAS